MKRSIVALAALAAAGLAWPVAAPADMYDLRQSDNDIAVETGVTRFQYRETVGGSVLDSEKSYLPTVTLSGRILTDAQAPGLLQNLYLELHEQGAFGTANYVGSLQDGTPFDGSTSERILNFSARFGHGFEIGGNAMLVAFGDIGYRDWSRNLQGPGGYGEEYGNTEAMAGLLGQISPLPRLVLSLEGAGGLTFRSSMTAGAPFNATFDLGSEPTWRTGGRIGYAITKSLEITGSADYTRLKFGASRLVDTAVGPAFEPDSSTQETTVQLGLAYHFF
ncbi:MAG TPA: hypothetical protein VMU42_06335 [Candidatus Sulfotelmatobacter sp.]|nr:hypothetical protein [Candidatus Sulfotelmatobacter sp.]